MTNSTVLALNLADGWSGFWRGDIGVWLLDRGVRIALLVIGGLLAARFINWFANRVVRRIDANTGKATSWCAPRAPNTARPSHR